jgi:polyvinyl alcohol dehydrogenase (cytochrome)
MLRLLAVLLVGAIYSQATVNACPDPSVSLSALRGWNGWGVDLANTRFQPANIAGLRAGDVPNLVLKWAFGLPGTGGAYGQPTIADGALFFGNVDGSFDVLDAKAGCLHWTFKALATVRSAVSIGPVDSKQVAFFGDLKANVYALAARNGKLLWRVKVDDHPLARIEGSLKLYEGRLYVPVSSTEEIVSGDPGYECCKFRGSIVALDAATGKQIWKTYSVLETPALTGKSKAGTNLYGPSGGGIWSSPTIDVQRKALYVGTGNQYSSPPSQYSDAILAMDLESGRLLWSKQLTHSDIWSFRCLNPMAGGCPQTLGTDADIASSPILKHIGGRDLLIVGQKSGIVCALDVDRKGEIVWQVRVGRGGALGGIMWGSAVDDRNVYVPLSDWTPAKPGQASTQGGGLFALKLATGERVWFKPPEKPACTAIPGCSPSQAAPATAIDGVVFSGSMDGHLRAYSTADGKVIRDFDTLREFVTVNGVKAHGGALNATGPTIADGMLFLTSSYAQGGMVGNVLLAFGK